MALKEFIGGQRLTQILSNLKTYIDNPPKATDRRFGVIKLGDALEPENSYAGTIYSGNVSTGGYDPQTYEPGETTVQIRDLMLTYKDCPYIYLRYDDGDRDHFAFDHSSMLYYREYPDPVNMPEYYIDGMYPIGLDSTRHGNDKYIDEYGNYEWYSYAYADMLYTWDRFGDNDGKLRYITGFDIVVCSYRDESYPLLFEARFSFDNPTDRTSVRLFTGSKSGLVPPATSADQNKFLKSDGTWGDTKSLPSGGTAAQILEKQSSTDGDADWADIATQMTQAEYDALSAAEKNDGRLRIITDRGYNNITEPMTWAEYQALSTQEKNDGTVRHITDRSIGPMLAEGQTAIDTEGIVGTAGSETNTQALLDELAERSEDVNNSLAQKVNKTVVSQQNVETLNTTAINSHSLDDLFLCSDGYYYRCTSAITGGSTTITDSNCEKTDISKELRRSTPRIRGVKQYYEFPKSSAEISGGNNSVTITDDGFAEVVYAFANEMYSQFGIAVNGQTVHPGGNITSGNVAITGFTGAISFPVYKGDVVTVSFWSTYKMSKIRLNVLG